ncbi:MAG TPA: hypothetical protein VFU47_18025 [Armatimonadota bacterium]|nr:hypothetical protein [Armatimonadota bacterium]
MTRWYLPALAAVLMVATPARAEEPAKAPGATAPVRGGEKKESSDPAAPGPSQPAAQPAQPDRDAEIQELKRIIGELQKRVEELEKRPAPAPPEQPAQPAQPEQPAPPPPDQTAPPARPSATFTPNISAIGNIQFRGGDNSRLPGRGRFNFDEFEIAFQDAVSPGLRYDVFLSAAKEEDWKLGMEEGYLTASRLGKGLTARLGEIRIPFGKFNPLHPHQWVFISQPSAVTAFLGPEGLVGDGAVVEYLLPTKGYFARAELGGWQTVSEREEGLGFAGGNPNNAWSGRLWLGKELGRDKELELGFSRYQGRGGVRDVGRKDLAVNGVDLTYRAYPGQERRILASAELLNHQTSGISGDTKNRLGGFLYGAYRMNRFWEAGLRGDYTQFPYPIRGHEWAASAFLTHYITEQTSLRLEYQYANSPFGSGNGIFFQILFGSGPHTHPLQ